MPELQSFKATIIVEIDLQNVEGPDNYLNAMTKATRAVILDSPRAKIADIRLTRC
jgi:hypothetical protein